MIGMGKDEYEFGDYMKERPMLNPKVWVVVNHKEKSIQHILNEGKPFSGDGSYMSLEYFTHHYKEEVNLKGYSYV